MRLWLCLKRRSADRVECVCVIFLAMKSYIFRALSTQQIVPEPNFSLAGTGWQICFLTFQSK